MNEKMGLGQFFRKYPNDEACLREIKRIRFGRKIFCETCKKETKFTKIKSRPVYQCACGYQISPLAGTIFEKTTTPLQYWFYAMFVMTVTRSGVSAKQLQRELGVTYKTARRMMKQIRILMAQVDKTPLSGTVEIDETYMGGKGKNRRYKWQDTNQGKDVVMGMIERNGRAYLKHHIPDTHNWTILNQIKENISPKKGL